MPHLSRFMPSLPTLDLTGVIDILVVAFLVYQALMVVRGTRAGHILIGILIMVSSTPSPCGPAWRRCVRCCPSSFRTSAWRSSCSFNRKSAAPWRASDARRWFGLAGASAPPKSVNEILLAVEQLRPQKTGALIVLERDIGLRTFIESGVRLESRISRDLLLSIFQPGLPLHDGAVIIQKDRISAAACFLPLTTNPRSRAQAGHPPPRRHRHHRRDRLSLAGGLRRDRPHLGGGLRRTVRRALGARSRGAHQPALRSTAAPPAPDRRVRRRYPAGHGSHPEAAGGDGCIRDSPAQCHPLLKWIRELLFENLGWKLLSLAVAVVIWALVASEPELSTFATVRLEYKNLPDELEISSDPVSRSSWNCADLPANCAAWETPSSRGDPRHVAAPSPGSEPSPSATATSNCRAACAWCAPFRPRCASISSGAAPAWLASMSAFGRRPERLSDRSCKVDPPELEVIGPRSHVSRAASSRHRPDRSCRRGGLVGVPGECLHGRSVCAFPGFARRCWSP